MGRYMEGGRETVTNRDLDTIVSNLKENKTNVRFSSRFVIFLTWIFRYFVVCIRHIYIFHPYQRLKLEFYDFLIEKRVHEISFKIVG